MDRLVLKGISRNFGGLKAVSDVSFSSHSGEIFGLIGPNGAGKTTLFNLVAGLYKPSSGTVVLDGQDISGRPPHVISQSGLGRSFQSPRLFRGETVGDNLRRAQLFASLPTPIAFFLGHKKRSPSFRDCRELAKLIGLGEHFNARAGSLAYGLQKALGIGIALATGPSILLMDEPAAGLNPTEKQTMGELIVTLRSELGVDVVVIEHDMRMMMSICDRLAVLNRGRLIALGTPAEIQSHPDVIDAYLGSSHELT